jgi:glycine/D-amino acid oxidase-like deaminating enzyme
MNLSIWEKESLISFDYIIVGGGIVGLSLALSLKQKAPSAEIAILERGVLPNGATTKNAGFACFGSVSELWADYCASPEKTLATVQMRWQGLQLLRQRLGDANIDYQPTGGYELIAQNQMNVLQNLAPLNQLLAPIIGKPDVFQEKKELVQRFGFQNIETIIENRFEGHLHSGKLFRRLYQRVCEVGCLVYTGAFVTHIETSKKHCFWVKTTSNETLCFSSPKGCICTNAFTSLFFPELAIEPGRGQVLVTEPLKEVPFRGSFHFEEGYFYFRDIGNRVLLGGGRHLAKAEETTTSFGTTPFIQQQLENLLCEIILPTTPHKIDYRWSGIMAFGPEKTPIIKQISEGLWVGARMNGMGVAIASEVAEKLSDLML